MKRLRKEQRDRDRAALIEEAKSSSSESSEDENTPARTAPFNPFDLLDSGEPMPDSEPSSDESEIIKEIPKVVAKKKNKVKQRATESKDDGLDEIDQSLKELDEQYGKYESAHAQESAPSLSSKANNLLTLNTKNLDAGLEMRRMFGSKVVNAQMERGNRAGKRVVRSLLSVSPTILLIYRTRLISGLVWGN
jgi:hypothetical protein